jgi:hypothetical protein
VSVFDGEVSHRRAFGDDLIVKRSCTPANATVEASALANANVIRIAFF